VAERLDLELLDERRGSLTRPPTASFEAYDAYLRGEHAFERAKELNSRELAIEAVAGYERAVELDAAFAVAHARIGEANGLLYFRLGDQAEERLQAARDAITRALELAPDLPEGRYALGFLHMNQRERAAALAEFERVIRTRPNYAEAYWASSMLHTVSGAWEQAFEAARKATELNPRAARHFCQMGGMSQAMGRYADADRYHDRSILVEGERACPYYCQLEVLLSSADIGRARSYVARLPPHVDREENPSINYYAVVLETIEGQYEDALALLATGTAEAYEAAWQYRPKRLFAAMIHELMGRRDLARQEYEAALAHLEPLAAARRFDPRLHSALALAYAGLDRGEESARAARAALEIVDRAEGLYGPYVLRELAQARTRLGDSDQALQLLERHLELSGYLPAAFLKLDPVWTPLRADPRFEALLDEHADGYRPKSAEEKL